MAKAARHGFSYRSNDKALEDFLTTSWGWLSKDE